MNSSSTSTISEKLLRPFSGSSVERRLTNEQDELLRSGVERKFEILGEALNRIRKDNPALLGKIREHRNIASFRNILVHGYDSIDHTIVWGIIEEDLGKLLEDVERLTEEEDRTTRRS